MNRLIPFLILVVLIAACTSSGGEDGPIAQSATATDEVIGVAPTDPPPPTETETTPAESPPTLTPVDVPSIPTEAPAEADEPAPFPTEPSEPEPAPTQSVAINGTYEGTYFRGSENAPVTLFDYSDFL